MPSGGAGGNNIQEYLVKLGVSLDTQNMNRLESFLKSSKVQAAALGGSLVALGTIIYKFVKSTTEYEYTLRDLAKTQHKTVEETRAQQNALKAMGKTAEQIKKDGSLNAIYKDIVKINKEMALPNMDGVLSTVSKLRNEFYTLKSTIQYALQWVNYYILQNLREPIMQITEFIKKARTWLQTNMKQISQKVASYITAFSKGLLGIVNGAKLLAQLFNRLPNGVKGAATAIMALFAVIKSGPLGQLLMAVEAVGGLLHDYDNYKWNKANPDKTPVAIAFPSIWELLDGSGTPEEKAKGITDLIVGALTGSAANISSGISKWIDENKDSFGSVIDSIGAVLSTGLGAVIDISGALIEGLTAITSNPEVQESIGGLLETIFTQSFGAMNDIGGVMVSGLSKILSGKTSQQWEEQFGKDPESNTWLGALGTGLIAKMFGASDQTSIALSIASIIAKGFGADDGSGLSESEGAYVQLKEAGVQIWEGLKGGLDRATDIAGDIAKTIGMALTGMKEEDWNAAFGEDNSWVTGFSTAMIGKLFGLSWGQSALAGIGTAIADAFTDTQDMDSDSGTFGKLWGDMKTFGGTIWKKITDGLTAVTDWWNSNDADAFKNDLKVIGDSISDTLFGKKDEKTGERSGGLWDKIKGIAEDIAGSEVFQNVTSAIREAFLSAFDGLWEAIAPKLNMLWVNMYNNMPDFIKSGLKLLGVKDPNFTAASYDAATGKTTLASTNGGTIDVNDPNGFLAALQNKYGMYSVDSNGQLVLKNDPGYNPMGMMSDVANMYFKALEEARMSGDYAKMEYAASLWAGFKKGNVDPGFNTGRAWEVGENKKVYSGLFNDLLSKGVPGDYKPTIAVDSEGAAVLPVKIDPETRGARRKIEQDLQKTVTVPVNAQITSTDGTQQTGGGGINPGNNVINLPMSRGGRTSGPRHALIGEDGTEYVIPITKPARAIDLITRMLSEMGGSAVNMIMENLGIGGSSAGTIGGSLATAGAMLGGGSTSIVYNNNVSAPVTINVQPGTASSQDVGSRVYSLTERYLLRTVQGVLA